MSEQAMTEVLKRIDALAAKLGVGAGEAWKILLRQARIEAIQDAVICAISIAIAMVMARLALAVPTKDYDRLEKLALCIGAGTIAGFLAICFGMSSFSEFMNPEFHAIKHILAVAK